MSSELRLAGGQDGAALGVEAAEHERQFREILDFCPAALIIVDEDGRLLFHNARLREILGYSKEELDLCDTRKHWYDLAQRERIIKQLRDHGGQVLNERVIWRTKKGALVHFLWSYVQVAYRGGHVSFVGGKRIAWAYDITAVVEQQVQVAEQERQLREIMDLCPAGLIVVDEEGRLGGYESCSAMRKRNFNSSTPGNFGTTSAIVNVSLSCCSSAAVSFLMKR